MATMMALRARTRGGPEVLVYESVPRPTPGDGELLVAVHAAAITFAELTWPETWASGGEDRTPIPSHEFSGVVAEVGGGVTGVSPGDEVYGLVPFDWDGAAAEYVRVPAAHVAAKPRTVSHVVAAAAALPALTAWEALVEHAAVKPGDRVLVHGSAGGVGSFLTQLGTALGAKVTGTARNADDLAHARALGAEHVIDVGREPIDVEKGVFDVLINAVGADTPEDLVAALRHGGRLITLQQPAPQELADRYGVTAIFFIVTAEQEGLARMAGMIGSGTLQVNVAATYPLADGRAAFESGAVRRSRPGKTVLVVRD
jgi:NADPH:quinone reductase-like Zn-dependent oxidoreductase